MKNKSRAFSSKKMVYIFLVIIFLFGLISGLIYYTIQNSALKDTLTFSLTNMFDHNIFSYKNLFIHIVLLAIILVLSFLFLSLPLIIIWIFFEGISFGFIIPIFIKIFKFNAIFNIVSYFVLTKLLSLFLLMIIFSKSLTFTKDYIFFLKKKKYTYLNSLKNIIVGIILFILNDLLILCVFNKILTLIVR